MDKLIVTPKAGEKVHDLTPKNFCSETIHLSVPRSMIGKIEDLVAEMIRQQDDDSSGATSGSNSGSFSPVRKSKSTKTTKKKTKSNKSSSTTWSSRKKKKRGKGKVKLSKGEEEEEEEEEIEDEEKNAIKNKEDDIDVGDEDEDGEEDEEDFEDDDDDEDDDVRKKNYGNHAPLVNFSEEMGVNMPIPTPTHSRRRRSKSPKITKKGKTVAENNNNNIIPKKSVVGKKRTMKGVGELGAGKGILDGVAKKKKKRSKKKGTWSGEEDEKLLRLVKEKGAKKWPTIAVELPNRNGKQCRERYLNHLDPSINHGEFSQEEDDLILTLHEELGNQWSKIAKKMIGRPANMIKNRWNSTLYKLVEDKDGSGANKKKKKKKNTSSTSVSNAKKKKRKRKIQEISKLNLEKPLTRSQTRYKEKPGTSPKSTSSLSAINGDLIPAVPSLQKKVLTQNDNLMLSTNNNNENGKDEKGPTRAFFFELPEDFEFEPPIQNLNSGSDSPKTPVQKKRKLNPSTTDSLPMDFFDMGGMDMGNIPNPFPSPRSLFAGRKDTFNNLAKKNLEVNNSSKKTGNFEVKTLDDKMGLIDNHSDFIKSTNLEKQECFEKLKLNLSDSALLASDYGIELKSPSLLSLELWTPKKNGEKKKNFLKINVEESKE